MRSSVAAVLVDSGDDYASTAASAPAVFFLFFSLLYLLMLFCFAVADDSALCSPDILMSLFHLPTELGLNIRTGGGSNSVYLRGRGLGGL